MTRTRRAGLVMVAVAVAAAAGCGSTQATSSPPSPHPTSRPATSAGAAVGAFLAAAAAQDQARVGQSLATATDLTDLTDLLSVFTGFGSGGRLFWEVGGVRVVATAAVDPTHADVTLSGPIVWCTGQGPADPAAMCNVVSSVSGQANTYVAMRSGGTWKANIDVDAGSALAHNPRATPPPGTASPQPT